MTTPTTSRRPSFGWLLLLAFCTWLSASGLSIAHVKIATHPALVPPSALTMGYKTFRDRGGMGVSLAHQRLAKASTHSLPTAPDIASITHYHPIEHQRHAMITLLSWSAASIGAGSAMFFLDDSLNARGFAIQNIAWGVIDVVIGIVALANLPGLDITAEARAKATRRFRRVLWINTALDVIYMLVGAGMMWLGSQTTQSHGVGILVQGGFLFLFDGINALWTYRARS